MTKVSCTWRLSAIAAVAFSVACLLVPNASADSIGAGTATACGGLTLCNGGSAYSLTALENGTESLRAVVGTSYDYLVNNDTQSSSFSFLFNGSLAINEFLTCQENGDFASDSCSISGALGTVGTGTDYGPPTKQTGKWNPHATVTLTGPSSGTFDIAVSLGSGETGTLTGMPESESTLALLATDLSPLVLLGLVGFLRKRHRSQEGAY